MEYGKALIDKAGEECGTFYRLHKETGFPQSTISEIRAGKRLLPLEWVPVLAEIARVDPRDALARVLAERLPEGSRARAILGGVTAAGAAEVLLLCVILGLLLPLNSYAGVRDDRAKVNPVYIVECWRSILCLFFMARSVRRWFSNTSPANDGRETGDGHLHLFPRSKIRP